MIAGDGGLDLAAFPSLRAARLRSLTLLARASAELAQAPDVDALETVAVAGSLGRLEAGGRSDYDCIIVAREAAAAAEVDAAVARVNAVFTALDLAAPKSAGIYRRPVLAATLLDPARLGTLDESPEVFGKRIQLLLEARPVLGAAACTGLQAGIVAWYGSGYLEACPAKSWTYLINDVVRYLHAYAARQQYRFSRSADDSWQLRQAKLRTSRILAIAGLLFLLGESNDRADKQAWLMRQLPRTPLERLQGIMLRHDPPAFTRLLSTYERATALLGDADTRAELVAGGPQSAAELARGISPAFAQIHGVSRELLEILTGFLLDRRGDWDPRFFERLLF